MAEKKPDRKMLRIPATDGQYPEGNPPEEHDDTRKPSKAEEENERYKELYEDALEIAKRQKDSEQMLLPLKFDMRYREIDGKLADSAINMIIKGLAILGADAAIVNQLMNALAKEIIAVERLAD